MKTSGTNRRIGALLTAITRGTLVLRPEFQRRLVWTNKHKNAFLDTVLSSYPFPEIYIAAGDVNHETGEITELLVDGQQRLSTLLEYFKSADTLRLTGITSYADLSKERKDEFLSYEVVVRDLGVLSPDEVKEIFQRINSTNYALNAMEIHNARYDGLLKQFSENLAQEDFFEVHRVFRSSEIRRMSDVRFVLTVIVTIMSTYFNRDEALEEYLARYNDRFEQQDKLAEEVSAVLTFIDKCNLDDTPRVWGKASLFTLVVEVYKALAQQTLDPDVVGRRLHYFYQLVEKVSNDEAVHSDIEHYYTALRQASNDRSSRILRGRVVQNAIAGEYDQF